MIRNTTRMASLSTFPNDPANANVAWACFGLLMSSVVIEVITSVTPGHHSFLKLRLRMTGPATHHI